MVELPTYLLCCLLVSFAGGLIRSKLLRILMLIGLHYIAFSMSAPTIGFFCLCPCIWIWQQKTPSTVARCVAEALLTGFLMSWTTSGFVGSVLPNLGWLVQSFCCMLYGLQIVPVSLAARYCVGRGPLSTALVVAAGVVVGEFFSALMGVCWTVTSMSLLTVHTPLAQFASLTTPFGATFILCFVTFLTPPIVPRGLGSVLRQFSTSAIGLTCFWLGGSVLGVLADTRKPNISVLLVQPNYQHEDPLTWNPSRRLSHLTSNSLDLHAPVDLIVWPEGSLAIGFDNEILSSKRPRLTQASFPELRELRRSSYLAGAVTSRVTSEEQFGLVFPTKKILNTAYLVDSSGNVQLHEKTVLVPLWEGLPAWARDVKVGTRVLNALKLSPKYSEGEYLGPLHLANRQGMRISLGVAICYESFFPWLEQFHSSESSDLIIHLVDDANTSAFESVMARHIAAVRLRAIETRKWNLICSMWSGSAIIDPRGQVVELLGRQSSTLLFDGTGSSNSAPAGN